MDVLSQGAWKELNGLVDPELKQLADSLPKVVLAGRAPATVRKYSGAFGRWKKWVDAKQGIAAMPASPVHVALYLSYLVQKASSSSPVQEAVSAISWAHQIATVNDPTAHPLVRNVLAGAKRVLAQPVQKKEPVTAVMLEAVIDKHAVPDLMALRTQTMCLVGFAGFLRFDEVSTLKERDLSIFEDHMELFLESSKTDQFRDGSRVVIACTSNKTCPVNIMERYLEAAGLNTREPSERFLFWGLV